MAAQLVSACPSTATSSQGAKARSSARAFSRFGFTLVELLVVIGIIAVLISILLPSLNAARRQANTAKCLSNLRQLGNAYFMYANDNKGIWPVAVWRPADGDPRMYRYATDAQTSTISRPWYWHMFIQKYVNSKIARDVPGTAIDQRGFVRANSIIWGCPNWDGWFDASFDGGFNLDEVGYGMNWAPTYRGDFPSPTNPDTTTVSQDGVTLTESPAWQNRAYYNMRGNVKPGRFFKQVEWKQPSERGLICDSEYFSPALDVPPLASGMPQAQPVHKYQNYGFYNLDFFRHGKVGKVNGLTYDMASAKPGINMLYCDGHASTLNSYGDVYMALRRKWK